MKAIMMAAVALATAAPSGAQVVKQLITVRYVATEAGTTIDTAYRTTVKQAQTALAARQWACAASLWRSALEIDAKVAEHWRDYGQALYNDGKHREAIAAFERAVQLGGLSSAEGAWEIARSYAWLGNEAQMYRWLAHARDAGFEARDAVRYEPAFARYLDDPRFESLAAGMERAIPHYPAGTVVSTAI